MSLRWLPLPAGPRSPRDFGSPQNSSGSARGKRIAHSRKGGERRLKFAIDLLEDRTLLSTAEYKPTFMIAKNAGGINFNASASPIGFTPAQVRTAYGINSILVGGITGDGTGQTVAIIDAYDWSTAASDLHNFDVAMGLPDPPSFTKLNQNGAASPLPASDAPGGWGVEEALDVEWVHSIAPMANIILVEADSPTDDNLIQAAVVTAKSLPGVSAVSMSFGRAEFDGLDQTENSIFTTPNGHNGVTFLASTGDDAAPAEFPSYSPNVVGVGGTSLFLNNDNTYSSESGWAFGGGGVSEFETQPAYQSSLPYSFRSAPDVSMIADNNTGVAVYDSYDFGVSTPWEEIGGTSLACPAWAGLIAIANQERVAAGFTTMDGPTDTLPLLYSLPSTDFHDVTTGNNGFAAGPGYDLVTGLGTPIANLLIPDMVPNHVVVTLSSPLTAVESTNFTASQLATFIDQTGLLATNTYTATIDWGDGNTSSGTIYSIDSTTDGISASHTYVNVGSYDITVTVTATVAEPGTASGTYVVSAAPLNGQGVAVNDVEGQTFTGEVGTFSTPNVTAPADRYTASIDWGDGNTSAGTVVSLGSGSFEVDGSNLYVDFGTYTITVTITDSLGGDSSFQTVATVTAAPINSTGKTLTAVEGTSSNATVASITTEDVNPTAADFTSVIDWGDGSATTTGTIVDLGSRFDVKGVHDYERFGTYTITIDTTSSGGATTSTTSTVTVSDAPLTSTPIVATIGQGDTFTGIVANITDTNTFGLASDLSATINWGDGSTPATVAGTINTVLANTFTANGSHRYIEAGTFTVVVTVTSLGGQTTSTDSTIIVTDAPDTATGTTITGPAGVEFTQPVATFVDAFNQAKLSEFTATIDWGDGSAVASGTVTQPGGVGTEFVVTGTHGYTFPGTYTITVTIFQLATQVATTTSTAVETDSPVNVTGVPLNPITVDQSFDGELATFTSVNLLAPTSFYLASIDWGDSSSATGTVDQLSPGVFKVSSTNPHAYSAIGTYTITVTILSLSGLQSSATTTLEVDDAPITVTSTSTVDTVSGTTFTDLLGNFTQYAAAPVSNLSANIDWGDDSGVQSGTVAQLADGSFTVTGTHAYRFNGTYLIHVALASINGSTGGFYTTAVVTDAPLTVSADSIIAIQGQPFSGEVATFTTPNNLSDSGEFTATVNWGDGTPTTGSVVTGGNGSFAVSSNHTYSKASADYAVTVVVYHHSPPVIIPGGPNRTPGSIIPNVIDDTPDTSSGSVGSARVLLPVSGALYRGSDSGYSNTDGITNVTQPVFTGTSSPEAVIKLYENAAGSTNAGGTLVGQTTADSSGNWGIQVNTPLADGSYVFNAQMYDGVTGNLVNDAPLYVNSQNAPLVVDTTSPTVSAVVLDPATGRLSVIFSDGVGMNPSAVGNAANYTFSKIVGTGGTQSLTAGGLTLSGNSNDLTANLTYALGSSRARARASTTGYVIEINALGITDLAGNTLVEKNFIAFPQTTNSPNPDYIAEIDVRSGVASAPRAYVSLAEQIAAGTYSDSVQKHRVVRVPHYRYSARHPRGIHFNSFRHR